MEQTYFPALPFNGMSKHQIEQAADLVVAQAIEDGKALEVAEACAAATELVEKVRKDPRFMDAVRTAASKQITTASGAKIESCETGTKYDYSQCGDPELAELEAKAAFCANQVKDRQKFLQLVPAAGLNHVTGEGEVVTIYPPSKSSTSSFKVTLKAK